MFGGTLGNTKTEKLCLKKTQENLKCHHLKVLDIYIKVQRCSSKENYDYSCKLKYFPYYLLQTS